MGSKISFRNLEAFVDALDSDLAWRKKELISLQQLIERERCNELVLLKAGVSLLCAHFEGFIKYASNCYIAYVSSLSIPYVELKNNFSAIYMRKAFDSCANSKKHSVHAALLDKFCCMGNRVFRINVSSDNFPISTHSNPSSVELKEILCSIGIENEIFETKKQYIDFSLLEKRHRIVHGEYILVDKDDFYEVLNIVLDLMDKYKSLLEFSSENNAFYKRGNIDGGELQSSDT